MKFFGESFGRSAVMALAFLAGVALVIVLFSESARRKVRVFVSRNFYRYKYDYKTQWLQFTERLSGSKSDDELLKSIVSGFMEVFGMACGALFLSDGERKMYYKVAEWEMEHAGQRFGTEDPFISDLLDRQALVCICDHSEVSAGAGDYFSRNGICFVIPLILNGQVNGFVAIGRPINRNETFDFEDYELMNTLSRQAASVILNLSLSDELSRAREMEAMGKLSAFVLHDLKNLVATLSMVVGNAGNNIDDPEFQKDMLDSLGGTVSKMNGLILRLKKIQEKGELSLQRADLLDLSGKTAAMISGGMVQVSGAPAFAEIDCEEIQKVILNLVLNSIEASGGIEPIVVEVGCGEMAYIRVNDKGCGISDEFIKYHLFQPFRTTKKGGLGIGLYQCRQAVEAHGGRIEVASEIGKGTTFTVWLPKVP
jgi:putative PEP-CTERM system histidine kinase